MSDDAKFAAETICEVANPRWKPGSFEFDALTVARAYLAFQRDYVNREAFNEIVDHAKNFGTRLAEKEQEQRGTHRQFEIAMRQANAAEQRAEAVEARLAGAYLAIGKLGIRAGAIRAALKLLWAETVAAGNDRASDYGWPSAREAVLAALEDEPPYEAPPEDAA